MREVVFYRTSAGNCPIEEFLNSLPAKAARKVTWVLNLLEELEVGPGEYFKKLSGTEEIWECRITYGSKISGSWAFSPGPHRSYSFMGLRRRAQRRPGARSKRRRRRE